MKKKQIEVEVVSKYGDSPGTCKLITYSKYEAALFSLVPFFTLLLIVLSLAVILSGVMLIVLAGVISAVIGGVFAGTRVFRKFFNKLTIKDGEAQCRKCTNVLKFSFKDARESAEGLCPRCATHYSVRFLKGDAHLVAD